MAKLMRESKLRERRQEKQARKDARRQTAQTLDEQLAETATRSVLVNVEGDES